MGKLKRFSCKQQLTIMFAAMVFLFMFFAMLIVFLGAFLLYRLGLVHGNRSVGVILVLFAVISLLVGAALSMVFSRFPLAPLRDLMNAIDRIADGDYSARINLKAPAELKKLSEKFNHMAEEIGKIYSGGKVFVEGMDTCDERLLSHEFKTPISSIQGFAEMLKLDDLTQEEREEYIQTIIEEASRLTALASNILNLSKIEQQSILTERTRLNVSEQIRQVIALLDKRWSAKDITVAFDCGEHFVVGNKELLKQVWINLADNAIKFSPEHETVEISIRETPAALVISFANKGDEIPAAAQSHIFDKFYQADTSHATQGNGLGLAIVHKIIGLHGGTVKVRRSDLTGTIMDVTLPQK